MSTAVPTLPPAPARGLAPDDYIQTADNWAAALPGFGDALEALGVEVETRWLAAGVSQAAAAASQAAAASSAAAAAASALTAVSAPGTTATSTTSLSLGLGSRSLVIQTGKALVAGQFVTVAYTSAPNNYMLAQVTSYNDTTGALVVDSIDLSGGGTYAAWSIGLSAPYINPNDAYAAMSALAFLNSQG